MIAYIHFLIRRNFSQNFKFISLAVVVVMFLTLDFTGYHQRQEKQLYDEIKSQLIPDTKVFISTTNLLINFTYYNYEEVLNGKVLLGDPKDAEVALIQELKKKDIYFYNPDSRPIFDTYNNWLPARVIVCASNNEELTYWNSILTSHYALRNESHFKENHITQVFDINRTEK